MVSPQGEGVSIVKVSGEIIQIGALSQIRVGDTLIVTGASGGVQLTSGTIDTCIIEAITQNSTDIYVGGSGGTNFPYSGHGFLLAAGKSLSLDVVNFNDVYVFAVTSGDKISYLGID